MTSEEPSIMSREEMKAELRSLLIRAYESGIDVEGGFECRNGKKHPDWDVIITEVAKKNRSE